MLNDFFLLLLLHCVLTFKPTIYLMQVYARMYVEKKKKRNKFEHKPRKMRPKQERMYVTFSLSRSNIEHIQCGRRVHCSGVHTYSLSFSVIIIIIIIELVQRERCKIIRMRKPKRTNYSAASLCIEYQRKDCFVIFSLLIKNGKYLLFT